LFNNRGDIIQRVNDQGSVIANYRYNAFGELLGTDTGATTPNPNPFRFSGEYWDAETGTYYLRARNFNPRTGRFTQPDPHWGLHNMIFGDDLTTLSGRLAPCHLAIMQAGNLYMYCLHNPIKWTDPSGRVIKLVGTEEEMQEMLYYLQSLTDDVLGVTAEGTVFISRMATSNIQFPNGNTLLRRMIASTHVVTISFHDDPDGHDGFIYDNLVASTSGRGAGGRIFLNHNTRAYTYTAGSDGISSLERMPRNIVLVHELIHADRAMRGVTIPLDQMADVTVTVERARFSPARIASSTRNVVHFNVRLEDWATVGLGHNVANDITENMIRREHGLRKRTSLRGDYR